MRFSPHFQLFYFNDRLEYLQVFVLLNTNEDILKNVGTEQFWGTIDFHCISFPSMKVNVLK